MLENVPVFWDFELFTALMVQVPLHERDAAGLRHISRALGTLLTACLHFSLPLSQACIAYLATQLLKHSLFIHLYGFLRLCFFLIMTYLFAAPCQKGSFAWTVSFGKGLLKISSRAAVLTYHCVEHRPRTEMRILNLSLFSSWFLSLWREGLPATLAMCIVCS